MTEPRDSSEDMARAVHDRLRLNAWSDLHTWGESGEGVRDAMRNALAAAGLWEREAAIKTVGDQYDYWIEYYKERSANAEAEINRLRPIVQHVAGLIAPEERYEDMVAQVEAWVPDPKVEYVKEQAIKYLRESIEFDLDKDGNDMRWYPKPVRLTGDAWLEQERARALEDLTRAEKALTEEIARVDDFNEHIDAFLRSPPPRGCRRESRSL